jgi:hypothetical protein
LHAGHGGERHVRLGCAGVLELGADALDDEQRVALRRLVEALQVRAVELAIGDARRQRRRVLGVQRSD